MAERFKDMVLAYIEAMTMPGSWCRQCGEKQMPGQDRIQHTAACFVRRFSETINAELKAERERCALVARTAVGDGCTEAERDVAILISAAILEN